MRISDWSSDVCSSDLTNPDLSHYVAPNRSNFQRRATVVTSGVGRPGHMALHFNAESEKASSTASLQRSRMSSQLPASQAANGTKDSQKKRTRSEEHTSELQSLMRISYAVFCLKTKDATTASNTETQ